MLGIDPGLATTGYAVLDKYDELNNLDLIKSGTIRTNSKSTKSTRLGLIFAELMELIELFQPDEIAVETQFIAKNVKAAMSVSEVRATALIAASRYGIPVWEISPREVKESITGWGNAPKEQVQLMLAAQINSKEIPSSLDASDAVAIGLTAYTLRSYALMYKQEPKQ
tara:strand:- start:76 stop:579 length:504 start_codon:yes stop_codon:yes gene_type:complete